MKRIVVIGDYISLSTAQKSRLEALGEVTYVPSPPSSEAWLTAVQGAEIICSDGDFLYENLGNLENVFVTYPYIELGSFDSEELAQKGVYVANTRGSNKNSIIEWVLFMTLALFRDFVSVTNATENIASTRTQSVEKKKVLIVGKGSIGTGIGEVLQVLGMEVSFFTRGDNFIEKGADADLVINALNSSPSSKNLLSETFFMSMKKGAYFISFVRPHTYDLHGLIKSLDNGILTKAALDADPESSGDVTNEFYQTALKHGKILVTPHVAFSTEQAGNNASEILVQNVENYINGTEANVVNK